jgi:predicted outer membrane repeat protein
MVSSFACPQSAPVLFYVDASAPFPGFPTSGTSWATAFPSLDSAIAAAAPSDVIWAADGAYAPTGPSGFLITKSLKIYGGFKGSTGGIGGETSLSQRAGLFLTTVLDGAFATPVVSISLVTSTPSVVIDGFQIKDGVANSILTLTTADGGGIYSHGSDLNLANCLFNNNFAGHDGGGLFFEGASSGSTNTLNIKLCEFRDNHVEHDGGAIFGSPVGSVEAQMSSVHRQQRDA